VEQGPLEGSGGMERNISRFSLCRKRRVVAGSARRGAACESEALCVYLPIVQAASMPEHIHWLHLREGTNEE